MELADHLALLRKRWVSVLALALVGLVAGLVASLATTPVYAARSQVYVSVQGSDTTTDLFQGSNFTVRQVKSYTELVSSPRVLQPVIDELGLADSAKDLSERIQAESPLDTALIDLTVRHESPQQAAEIADATASSLSEVVTELETPRDGGASPVQISTVRAAVVPEEPSSPNLKLNLALGLLVGLALGVGFALMRELLDTRVRTVEDVESLTDTSVLGIIGFEPDAPSYPLIVQESPQSMRAEALRRLRTNLQFLEVEGQSNAIVMTSALPGEGKSTTTINLAITLADAGQRVALVDADLRRPSVAKYMGIEGSVGLTTVLIGRAGIDDVIQPWGNGNLDVITSGQIPPNPSELLGSRRMAAFIDELTPRYDVVLIDTSPLLPVTDGAILARLVGGAVVVVGAGTIHKAQLEDALVTLTTVNARVLGMVVNRVPMRSGGAYAYHYYEYTSDEAPQPDRRGRRRVPSHASTIDVLGDAGRRRRLQGRRARPEATSLPQHSQPDVDTQPRRVPVHSPPADSGEGDPRQ
jgi:capsular exopolysaccharide synthesis family protein